MSNLSDWFRVNNSKIHIERFARDAARSIPADALVLDAGAGSSPYQSLFSHCRYEATDICIRPEREYANMCYVCDLKEIPVEESRFDLILCTQVLEHVNEPAAVVSEFFRVIKPGGQVWLSAPLYYPEHEAPSDFFRYTQFGLRHLFEKAGFEVQQIDWAESYFGTLAFQLGLARHYLPRTVRECGGGPFGLTVATLMLCTRPVIALMALMFAKLDLAHRYTARGHCIDYTIVAKKPVQNDPQAKDAVRPNR